MKAATQHEPPIGSGPKGIEFPTFVDSSARGAFADCPMKFFYQYLRHLHSLTPSVHLHAGGAFAKGMEVTRKSYYAEGFNAKVSVGKGMVALIEFYGDYMCPTDSAKSCENLLQAFDYYFVVWGIETDSLKPFMNKNVPAIEFSFALPIPDTKHPVSGDPILYTGRFDMLGQLKSGGIYVVDEKTTKALGPTWTQQWDLKAQFSGYCWAARQYGYEVEGAIIRGISILKRSNGHAQAITYRPPWKIDLWLEQLIRDVNSMIRMWEEGHWEQNFDAACSLYGGCSFKPLCEMPNPEQWITGNYTERVWDPLA